MARTTHPLWAVIDGIRDQKAASTRPSAPMMEPSVRLEARTYMVTGANVGLGNAIAYDLAARGATVILACRSGIPRAGERIARLTGNDKVTMRQVDLADLRQVHTLCDRLCADGVRLDGVVCNAAVMPATPRLSPQGLELMFAINYFANVVLLSRLLSDGVLANRTWSTEAWLPDAPVPRIVLVSSEAHRQAEPLDFATWGQTVSYNAVSGMRRYGSVKLALTTFGSELARRLAGDVAVHSLCPGAVNTSLAREAPRVVKPLLARVMRRFFADPAEAARPVVRLLADPRIEGEHGLYMHMSTERQPSALARDPANGARIWAANVALAARVDPRRWVWPTTISGEEDE